MKRLSPILLLCCLMVLFSPCVSAHPGRTDSSGGHYNRSTGEYHYHHGYSAHQHPDGVCPYDFDDKTGQNSGSGTSKSKSSSTSSTSKPSVTSKPAASSQPEAEIPDETPPAVAAITPDGNNGSPPKTWGIIALISTLGVAVLSIILYRKQRQLDDAQRHCEQIQRSFEMQLSQIHDALQETENQRDQQQEQLSRTERAVREAEGQRDHAEQLYQVQSSLAQKIREQIHILERDLEKAQEKAAKCDQFIRVFGPSAEEFFRSAGVEPRLCRMAADYLTMVYDASANYLERKSRPAYTEARRIRELKAETKLWIERATRAEYRLQEAQNRKLLESPPEE